MIVLYFIYISVYDVVLSGSASIGTSSTSTE